MPQPVDARAAAGMYPRGAVRGVGLAWLVFWALQFGTYAEALRDPAQEAWKLLVWEGSSMVLSMALVFGGWRHAHRLDPLLARPWRWFGVAAASVPILIVPYVVAVFELRWMIYGLFGHRCSHDWSSDLVRADAIDFAIYYPLFLAVMFGVRSFVALNVARVAAARERALAQQAQLLQLTQQLRPHFLFNALNTVADAIAHDPVLAERLLLSLARLLRAATDLSRRPESRLDDEISLLEAYAAIMQERFAERVRVRFDVDAAARDSMVPSLLLQPLLENAFRHGVETQQGPCHVVVSARRIGDRLELEVQDDAGTLGEAPVFGVGLSNLQQRLATRFGGKAALSLKPRTGRGVIARIEMPCVSWS